MSIPVLITSFYRIEIKDSRIFQLRVNAGDPSLKLHRPFLKQYHENVCMSPALGRVENGQGHFESPI